MAEKLTDLIADLIDDMGGSQKPDYPAIRSRLVDFRSLADSLENATSTGDADLKIKNLESELKEARALLQKLQAEQEQEKYDIPEIQWRILDLLPSEHSGSWLMVNAVASSAGIPIDEAEVHISHLRKAGLVVGRSNSFDAVVLHRSVRGTEYVMARRMTRE